MEINKLKKILAGLSIAGLLASASLTLPGCPKPPPGQTA
ncbi:MAG: SbtA family thio(seleno)oxazole RiPP natural product precursor [Desulfobacteraceae bacterium]